MYSLNLDRVAIVFNCRLLGSSMCGRRRRSTVSLSWQHVALGFDTGINWFCDYVNLFMCTLNKKVSLVQFEDVLNRSCLISRLPRRYLPEASRGRTRSRCQHRPSSPRESRESPTSTLTGTPEGRACSTCRR